jgi:hypothetical protein
MNDTRYSPKKWHKIYRTKHYTLHRGTYNSVNTTCPSPSLVVMLQNSMIDEQCTKAMLSVE